MSRQFVEIRAEDGVGGGWKHDHVISAEELTRHFLWSWVFDAVVNTSGRKKLMSENGFSEDTHWRNAFASPSP